MARFAIRDFMIANAAYIGAVVHFFAVVDGEPDEEDLITLYEGLTGADTLPNPQKLDSEGKFNVPVYADEATIARVSGLAIDDHDTGIIQGVEGTPSINGAMVYSSVDITNPTFPYSVVWDTASYNNPTCWTVGSPTKLIVPSGFDKARVTAHVEFLSGVAADSAIALTIYKNGSAEYVGAGRDTQGSTEFSNPALNAMTGKQAATAGDEYVAVVDCDDASVVIDGSKSWFEMELE